MSNFIKRTGLFLQARLNSKRMPGKSLMNICGKPLIAQCIERLNVVPADCKAILTTKDCEPYFRPIALSFGWEIFIGDEQNVLKRFVDAANYFKVNTIIRATADNPLLSSEIAIETLDLFNKGNCDLAYLKPIPYGSGVEVISFNALNTALQKTKIPYHLEHVTPYIYEHKDKFKIKEGYFNDEEVHRSDIRLTVDTRDDYEKINHLFRELNKKSQNMKIRSVISTYDSIKFVKHRRILFITAFSDSYGMGHLNRINMLSEKLKKDFSIYFSFKHGDKHKLKDFKKSEYNYIDYDKLSTHVENSGVFDRVIVDLRDTTLDEMKKYKALGSVISIDDMGQGGKISDININTLPIVNKGKEKLNFNFNGIEYLMTTVKKEKENTKLNNPPKNILVSFGGSDPSSFTQPVIDILAKSGYKITVIQGPYFNKTINETENCKIVKDVYQLDNYIKSSDLIITSFGMTFLESLILEKPVLLINHTDYHDELTENFCYPYYIKRDEELLNDLNSTKEHDRRKSI
jgi:spore coat polysaccharide biosynthesis protein SpsF